MANAATLFQLAQLGSNLSVDASQQNAATLFQLATIMAQKGTKLTVRNSDSQSPATLFQLANIGKGQITFEV